MAKTPKTEVRDRAGRVKLLAMDVDGVLTDGVLLLGDAESDTPVEACAFHVRDGLGLALARTAGLTLAWITGRRSLAVQRRARQLQVTAVLDGVRDKAAALRDLAAQHAVTMDEVGFIGDDLNDAPAMRAAGFAACPADAARRIQAISHYVAAAPGGGGAVREIVELVLEAQGRLEWACTAFVESLEASGRGAAGDQ